MNPWYRTIAPILRPMFVDQAVIVVRAGKGGDGAVAFRREKGEPKGGPHGGDGGKGGDVVIVSDLGMSTLLDFKYQREWEAQEGDSGGKKQVTGGDGKDLEIFLPPGTLLYNHETGELLHDLKPGERVIIAKGGRGGFGNEHYKTSVNQTPRHASPGTEGEAFTIRLELKLIAEVGFVGMPNAGKSTLLAALTRANPKIANYPFTTLSPQLGIAELDGQRRIVLADIPGLIEGASQGAGLGHEFLRHVERTRVIVHLLDCMPDNQKTPAENYKTVRAELEAYSPALAAKPELVVLNKVDQMEPADAKKAFKDLCRELGLRQKDALVISGATRTGVREMLETLWVMIHPDLKKVDGWKPVEED